MRIYCGIGVFYSSQKGIEFPVALKLNGYLRFIMDYLGGEGMGARGKMVQGQKV